MRKLTSILKSEPFELTTEKGTEKLKFTEFSIQDITRLIELQKPLVNDLGAGSLNDLYRTRIMCSVKRCDNDKYYWPGSIHSFNKLNLPAALVDQLTECVNELNPINEIQEDLNTKKNDS